MTAAYNGSFESRPAREYWLRREEERNKKIAIQKSQDSERLDEIFDRVMDNRLSRSYTPERNEELIAGILRESEQRASEEHQLMVDSRLRFGTPSDYLGTKDLDVETERKDFSFSRK